LQHRASEEALHLLIARHPLQPGKQISASGAIRVGKSLAQSIGEVSNTRESRRQSG